MQFPPVGRVEDVWDRRVGNEFGSLYELGVSRRHRRWNDGMLRVGKRVGGVGWVVEGEQEESGIKFSEDVKMFACLSQIQTSEPNVPSAEVTQ